MGGPTANFRAPSCTQQLEKGVCKGARRCLAPLPCPKLRVDHSEYLAILRKMRALPGVKKVFIRSGIRFDYLVHDRDERFFRELVEHHVSGQLKVAPEHCAPAVLRAMGKPPVEVYERFEKRFYELSRQAGREQYLVPYLLSSHPGSTLRDAVALAAWLHKHNLRPEQVQDFYPTPGTVSTCMFYTGLDPYTGEEVHVPRKDEEKALQRALLQYFLPKNARLVHKALLQCHREDLIPVLLPASARRGAQTGTSTPRAKGSPPAKGEGKNTGKKDASARGRAAGKAPTGRGNDWGKTAGKASIGRGGKPGKAAGSSAGTPAGPPRRSRKDNSKPGRPGRRRA